MFWLRRYSLSGSSALEGSVQDGGRVAAREDARQRDLLVSRRPRGLTPFSFEFARERGIQPKFQFFPAVR